MAFVKVTKNQYHQASDVEHVLWYIANPLKCNGMVCGGRNIIGMVEVEPDDIADQFLSIQSGRKCLRRIYHVIISFDTVLEEPDPRFLDAVGQAVCRMYPEYQSAYSVHDNTANLHIHVVFNNCSVYSDEKNLTVRFDRFAIERLVDRMVYEHLGMPVCKYGQTERNQKQRTHSNALTNKSSLREEKNNG